MTLRSFGVLSILATASLASSASAFDRVRAGQWETTVTANGQSTTRSACVAKGDADAINGDLASVRAFVEKNAGPGCKVTDVKVNAGQVIVTSLCAGAENVGKTTYRGDSYDSADSNGTTARSRRVGACPQGRDFPRRRRATRAPSPSSGRAHRRPPASPAT
jgi:hypothetical protein